MCKKRMKVRICIEDRCRYVDVELHPAGCMGASRTHLDIPEKALPSELVAIAMRRGYRFNWTTRDSCLLLIDPLGVIPIVKLCGPVPRPRAPPLMRRLRKGRVYLGL